MEEFIIKCTCSFVLLTTGKPEELKDIYEFPNGCKKCGKIRKFRCPKCGKQIRMLPVRR